MSEPEEVTGVMELWSQTARGYGSHEIVLSSPGTGAGGTLYSHFPFPMSQVPSPSQSCLTIKIKTIIVHWYKGDILFED